MIKRFFSLVIFVSVGWLLGGTPTEAQIGTKTAKVGIKFAGTNTCAYVDPSDGHVRLKQAYCDPADTTLHFELSGPPGGKLRLRHIATNRCLFIDYDQGSPPPVVGVACSSISPAFYLADIAPGIHAIKQDRVAGPGLVRRYCLKVGGNSANFVVGADICSNAPPTSFRFKLEYL